MVRKRSRIRVPSWAPCCCLCELGFAKIRMTGRRPCTRIAPMQTWLRQYSHDGQEALHPRWLAYAYLAVMRLCKLGFAKIRMTGRRPCTRIVPMQTWLRQDLHDGQETLHPRWLAYTNLAVMRLCKLGFAKICMTGRRPCTRSDLPMRTWLRLDSHDGQGGLHPQGLA